jgi:hypothetical protein
MEFVEHFVSCNFGSFAVDVIVDDVLGRAGESKEYAMVAVRVAFSGPLAWLANGDRAAKGTYVAEVRDIASPGFLGSLANGVMIGSVVEICHMNKGVGPVLCS